MKINVGTIDRVVRVIVGLVLIAFALGFVWPATGWNWVGWIGIIPLATGAVGSCPLYSVLGLSTCADEEGLSAPTKAPPGARVARRRPRPSTVCR